MGELCKIHFHLICIDLIIDLLVNCTVNGECLAIIPKDLFVYTANTVDNFISTLFRLDTDFTLNILTY